MSPVLVFSPQRRKPREVEVVEGGTAPVVATRAVREVDGGQAAATAVVVVAVTRATRAEEAVVGCVVELPPPPPKELLLLNAKEQNEPPPPRPPPPPRKLLEYPREYCEGASEQAQAGGFRAGVSRGHGSGHHHPDAARANGQQLQRGQRCALGRHTDGRG